MKCVAILSFLLFCSIASAQEPFDIGLFADPEGTISTVQMTAGDLPTSVYVVVFDVTPFRAFSLGVTGVDPEVALLHSMATVGGLPLTDWSTHPYEWLYALGMCHTPTNRQAIMEIQIFALRDFEQDTALCLTGESLDNFGAPALLECSGETVLLTPAQNGQERYPNGCLIVNATGEGPVAKSNSSFGAVKAMF